MAAGTFRGPKIEPFCALDQTGYRGGLGSGYRSAALDETYTDAGELEGIDLGGKEWSYSIGGVEYFDMSGTWIVYDPVNNTSYPVSCQEQAELLALMLASYNAKTPEDLFERTYPTNSHDIDLGLPVDSIDIDLG